MALAVDRRAVGRGMGAYLAVAAPSGLLIALLHGSDTKGQESNLWTVAAVLVILVAPIIGGIVAGGAPRVQGASAVAGGAQQSPLVHGALAVAGPAGVFLVARAIVGAAQGGLGAAQVVRFALYLVVFTSLGMFGGYAAFRRRQRLA